MSNALELYSACFFAYNGTQYTDPHLHEDAYQIYYVAGGSIQFLFRAEWITLTKGQFLLMPPGVIHGMKNQGPSDILDIKFNIFDKVLRTNVNEKLPGICQTTPATERLFSTLAEMTADKGLYFDRIFALYLEAVFYQMLQDITPPPPYLAEEIVPRTDPAHLSPCVHRVLPFIEGAVVLPIVPFSTENIAKQIGYNKRYVSSKFSEEMGISLTQYFRLLRIKRAKELLCNTDLKISAISRLLNYEDVSHFIKHFKKSSGMSPNEYRNHHRNATV